MTNEMIIFSQRCRMMDEGILKGTGRFVEIENENGEKVQMEEPEAIHTYKKWQELGYQVKKGQKAIAQFPIWKYNAKISEMEMINVETGKKEMVAVDDSKMFMKKASFFKMSQVERIQQ